MAELLHLTERALWDAARASGTYEMSTRGLTLAEVGFIHCSHRHQLPQVARMLYEGLDPEQLVVLVIDSERLSAPVRFEAPDPVAPCADGRDGEVGAGDTDDAASADDAEKFPHIYGPLPVTAVVAEEPWSWNSP